MLLGQAAAVGRAGCQMVAHGRLLEKLLVKGPICVDGTGT